MGNDNADRVSALEEILDRLLLAVRVAPDMRPEQQAPTSMLGPLAEHGHSMITSIHGPDCYTSA